MNDVEQLRLPIDGDQLSEKERKLAKEIDKEFTDELQMEENIIEALLFAKGNSVSLEEIKTALDCGEKPALKALNRLIKKYEERHGGIIIQTVGNHYQMTTNPECFDGLIRVAKHPKKPVLSDIVMETLAIIAYKQPVTKAEIERVRGVSSDHAVNKLVEYGLAYEVGRLNAPGRPALFATTEEFLRRFGVSSLDNLPNLNPEMEDEIKKEVNEEVIDIMGAAPTENQEEVKPEQQGTIDSSPEMANDDTIDSSPKMANDDTIV
ncbi:MAG: SMC-Scp complex subunit ScpB [Oribacterium sp.]|nr:SMC-Scp complex subunit ScpB [Oribacterium sp.]MBP3804622.1 SMC-Scp complex subunit ScpB [Oribacterium sp.]MBR1857364.1 SMC-Scp complex subunit ScpB [Oribacterium sp.]